MIRLEVTFEYPGEYVGIGCCILATKEEEASIFDRGRWQPVPLLVQRFRTLFTKKVNVLVVHHIAAPRINDRRTYGEVPSVERPEETNWYEC